MRQSIGIMLVIVSLSLITVGCGKPEAKPNEKPVEKTVQKSVEAPRSALTIKGKVAVDDGVTTPKSGKVFVLRSVDGKGGDYAYLFGQGIFDAKGFEVSFAQNPPAEALTVRMLGVAMIVAVANDVEIPKPGKLDGAVTKALIQKAVGNTRGHGVIFVGEGEDKFKLLDKVPWLKAFKRGELQCGVGQKKPEGFDIFVPTACDGVVLNFGKFGWINWT